MSLVRRLVLGISLVAVACIPLIVKSPYMIHILIIASLNIALALGYNLSVGSVGTISLAHGAFYGLGGYVAALLSIKFGVPFIVELLAAAAFCGGLAFLVGMPSFRLPERAFAIGTLTFALVAEQVVHNWVSLTQGPMCLVPIPRPKLILPLLPAGQISSLNQYYYLAVLVALLTLVLCSRIAESRIGRAFAAVRENEVLARSMGINSLKYKMLALTTGAAIAGVTGACYAHYAQIICPNDLGLAVIINLLIIVYVGGVGTVRGIVLGSIAITVLPEALRVAPRLRLLIYGVVLLLMASYMPDGLEGLVARVLGRVSRTRETGVR